MALKRAIKFIALGILAVLLIFVVLELSSNTPVAVLKRLIAENRLSDKNINLKLNYLSFIPAGEASLVNLGKKKFRKEDLLHIRAEAKTFDFARSIFYAKATVDSYIDPKELHSVYFLQHLEMINKPDEDKEIHYDQKRHIMIYRGPRGTEERMIDEHAQDPLSAFFYLQNKKFNIGEEFSLNFNTNQKNYILKGRFISKESMRIYDKDYEIIVAEAHVGRKDKNPRHQTSFKIWFLKSDGKNIPILFKIMTNVGPIVVKAQ